MPGEEQPLVDQPRVPVKDVRTLLGGIETLQECKPVAQQAMHTSTDACSFHVPSRLQVKEDGINISDWLQSLAKFTGAVCRK
eukprot:298344-Pelagomonas_calceolata.AAC.6